MSSLAAGTRKRRRKADGAAADWIQGHDLGRKFKALVCHDGVFSTQNQWSTEELFFPEHDFGGTLWESRETYQRWDPSLHTQNWATPQLVRDACCRQPRRGDSKQIARR